MSIWDTRYKEEKQIWGNQPSLTVYNLIDPNRRSEKLSVFEIGCGYGRDTHYISHQGHFVDAVEPSFVGAAQTQTLLQKEIEQGRVNIFCDNFQTMDLPKNCYDRVLSHRVLHLIEDGEVTSFIDQIHKITKKDGLIAISARSQKDKKPGDTLMDDHSYQIEGRPDHIVHFWTENRFTESFGKQFEILEFKDFTEIESEKTGQKANLLLMVARKL
jgi:SAM-dependent methyltransferase